MRILHVPAPAAPAWVEARRAALIRVLGKRVEHVVADALPELEGRPTPGRLQRLARAMQGFDLVLTHDWGAINAALAHAVFRDQMGLAPLVHHEDALDPAEARGGHRTRKWVRRVALWRASALVVPTQRTQALALGPWQQPRKRVRLVRPGVTIAPVRKVRPDLLPRLVKRPGEMWLGSFAPTGGAANEAVLPILRAFAALPEQWRFVIAGEGTERERVLAEAARLGVEDRVHLVPVAVERAKALGLFDIFAPLDDATCDPVPIVEGMAAGRPMIADGSGDGTETLSPENRTLQGSDTVAKALQRLAGSETLRREIGAANRDQAQRHHDRDTEIAAFREVYAQAMGRPSLP